MDIQDEVVMEELEDGELSSNSCDEYTPLERPQNYGEVVKPTVNPIIQDTDSEENDISSDEDSDDSSNEKQKKSKRQKIKLRPKISKSCKRKKFDIWTTKVQEDVLSETLNSCDVTQKDRSRDIESYDYTIFQRQDNSNKRTRDERSNIHRRLGKRKSKDDVENGKGAARVIPDLETNIENTDDDIAKDMANKLCELKEELVLRSLKLIGKEKCIELFKQTQEIEADGGMSVMNFTRRRTPGGVFFYLIKMDESIEQKLKTELFLEERKRDSKEKKRKQSQRWKQQKDKEREKILPELLSKAELLFNNRNLKEVSEAVFKNPPPTPETDGHENSCDDTEGTSEQATQNQTSKTEKCIFEEKEDILEIQCSNMDLM